MNSPMMLVSLRMSLSFGRFQHRLQSRSDSTHIQTGSSTCTRCIQSQQLRASLPHTQCRVDCLLVAEFNTLVQLGQVMVDQRSGDDA